MITIGTGICLYALSQMGKHGSLDGEIKPGVLWLIAVALDAIIGLTGALND